jgi:alpha-glucosidase
MKYLLLIELCVFSLIAGNSYAAGQQYTLHSPDKHIKVAVSVGGSITYRVSVDGKTILLPSPIGMALQNGNVYGQNAKVQEKTRRKVNKTVAPGYGFNDHISDRFNELTLRFKKPFSLVFRAYDNGVAYRIKTRVRGTVEVKNERVTYNFPQDEKAWYLDPTGRLRKQGYESPYAYGYISKMSVKGALPLLIDHNSGIKVLLTEADLYDYPGLYLTAGHGKYHSLNGTFPAYPTKVKKDGVNLDVERRADYIAKTQGTRSYPWRVMILARRDNALLNNELVYLLATPNKLRNSSWIKPGLAAWGWWSDRNLSGVGFKTGINMDTYKYYIDFANKNGIPYVLVDAGWSDMFNLLDINKNLNMSKLARYAKEKHVRLILWCDWHVLGRQLNQAMHEFDKWGIAGIKVDFIDRDDQKAIAFYTHIAKVAAKHHLIVDYHGASKPTGLSRTYPNIVNWEAVMGLETDKFQKFKDAENPHHDVMLPFTRLVAGPMDYTPGAMRNSNKQDFRVIGSRPMSQGTRCHQLAMYVDYYAPLQMLAGSLTAYEKEPPILDLLSNMPITWDRTVPLEGKVGEYLLLTRRKGDTWYIGGMTNWAPRDLSVNLTFLGKGKYDATIYSDGANSGQVASDYDRSKREITASTKLNIHMAPGGGWVAVIKPAP